MEKKSKSNPSEYLLLLEAALQDGWLPKKLKQILEGFYYSYKESLESHNMAIGPYESLFATFLRLVEQQCKDPYSFLPYHQQIRTPFDYYAFGLNFLRPLVDTNHSSVHGLKNIQEISSLLQEKENVVLLANHQTEADPQAIGLLLEKDYPAFASEIIFVAGERVVTDPLAIPFSMGCNLLCIYSKRYIDNPPEDKLKKQLHNKKTMELMKELLKEGGKCIYVAPSGGRDRRNASGIVEVAPFDPQSIEMFYLMAQRAEHPTHFYPLTLATYDLLPPPQTVQQELGEMRLTKRGGIHLAMGAKIDMEEFPGQDISDKHARRAARAEHIHSLVDKAYQQFLT